MPTNGFDYRALRLDGEIENGSVVVESEREAYDSISNRGLFPLVIEAGRPREMRRVHIAARDLALGLRILADLLEAGLPISRALSTFEELAPNGWKVALPSLRESVKEGKSLASALADAPLAIPPLVVGIARAGEAGAGIAGAIRRAADITEASASTQAAVRAALAYPMILAVAGTGSIGVLIGVVLPRFALILADLGQQLPASTRLVLQGSAAARAAFFPALGGLVVGALALRVWTATTAGRITWHSILLNVPLIGNIRTASAAARTTASLSTLLESGVPLRTALGFASKASGDAAVESRVIAARARIVTGQSIGQAFAAEHAVTTVAAKLIHAGEQSGRLTSMLAHAGRLEQERADRLTQVAVRFLEPTLLLTFAGLVALVAAALLQAIYSVRPAG